MTVGNVLALLLSVALSSNSHSDGTARFTLATGGTTHRPPVAAGSFSASLFTFKVDRPDDGKGEGGGWQKATADLKFVDGRSFFPDSWTCTVTIGMAIRSKVDGVIPPDKAARISAQVVTKASSNLMPTEEKWLPSLFCSRLGTEMLRVFSKEYGSVGAKVQKSVQKIP